MYLFYMSPILVVKCGDKYNVLGISHIESGAVI